MVGPEGRPFRGATVAGLRAMFEEPATLDGDTFTAQAILPEDARTVAAVHAGKKLGGTAVVRASQKSPPVVRLAAWGALTGRVVGPDGKPIAGAEVRLHFAERAAAKLLGHQRADRTATWTGGVAVGEVGNGFAGAVVAAGAARKLSVPGGEAASPGPSGATPS